MTAETRMGHLMLELCGWRMWNLMRMISLMPQVSTRGKGCWKTGKTNCDGKTPMMVDSHVSTLGKGSIITERWNCMISRYAYICHVLDGRWSPPRWWLRRESRPYSKSWTECPEYDEIWCDVQKLSTENIMADNHDVFVTPVLHWTEDGALQDSVWEKADTFCFGKLHSRSWH